MGEWNLPFTYIFVSKLASMPPLLPFLSPSQKNFKSWSFSFHNDGYSISFPMTKKSSRGRAQAYNSRQILTTHPDPGQRVIPCALWVRIEWIKRPLMRRLCCFGESRMLSIPETGHSKELPFRANSVLRTTIQPKWKKPSFDFSVIVIIHKCWIYLWPSILHIRS